MSNTPLKIKLIFTIFLFTIASFFFNQLSYSQDLTDAEVKTALVYNFIKYLDWESPLTPDTLTIGVYGNAPSMTAAFKKINNKRVRGKRIKVLFFKKMYELVETDILYVNYEKGADVNKLYKNLKGSSTLLITDRYEDRREVMINFIHDENNKVQFEINSKNINEANISILPKLLLLGGTELDIRELYKEAEQSLISEREKSGQIEKELNLKKVEIVDLNERLNKLHEDIDSLNKVIEFQLDNIAVQKSNLIELKKELSIVLHRTNEQKKELESASIALQNKNLENIKLDSLLTNKQYDLETRNTLLNNLQDEITDKEQILNRQKLKIQTQRIANFIFVAFLVLLLIFLYNIYRNYKLKQAKNIELEKRNIQINNQNIKIQKQAQELIKNNIELEKLSIVAQKTDNAVIIMDHLGDLEWVNKGFERMFGYTMDEFVKLRGNNFINASTYDNPKEILNICLNGKRAVSYNSFVLIKSGDKKWLQSTITPVSDNNNNIIKLVAIDTDITKLKEAENKIINKNKEIEEKAEQLRIHSEELKTSNKELEIQKNRAEEALRKLKNAQSQLVAAEKMASLGQLTSGIAHEINNPINYISSSIEGLRNLLNDIKLLLKEYESLSIDNLETKIIKINKIKEEIDYLDLLTGFDVLTHNIKLGIDRTKEIVNSLRTFSRMDEANYSLVDINEVINSTLILLEKQIKDRIIINKRFGELPKVECIASKINQAIMNILVNAIQAINKEGIIDINTSLVTKDKKQYVKIVCKDNGEGMPEDVVNKIFEPFFTTKEVGEGTGLGLSITYSVIKNHNGFIEVESKPKVGTIFNILIPIKKAKTTKTEAYTF